MTASEALKRLINSFQPYFKPSAEYKEQFIKIIGSCPESVIAESYKHTIENDTKPPSIASFRAYCYEFQDRENAKRHAEQMQNDRKTADAMFKKDGYGNNEYARACFQNIKLAMGGKVTRQEFIDNCRTLKLNVSDYMRYAEEWDLDMSNIIGSEYQHNFEGTKGYSTRKQFARIGQ